MPDTDQQAPEVVREPVQRPDRIANLGVGVGAAIPDVVRDRIDHEEPDAAEVVSERSQLVDVVGKTNALPDAVAALDVSARSHEAWLEVDLGRVLARDEDGRSGPNARCVSRSPARYVPFPEPFAPASSSKAEACQSGSRARRSSAYPRQSDGLP